ncbi:hypothetical protein [Mesorhizobium sp. BHbdii]
MTPGAEGLRRDQVPERREKSITLPMQKITKENAAPFLKENGV